MILQVDVEAADGALEQVGVRLVDGHHVAVGITRDEARILGLTRRTLHDGGITESSYDDLVLQEDPERVDVHTQVPGRLKHRSQGEGL